MFRTLHTSPYNGHLWPPTLVPELHDRFIYPQPTLSLGNANAGLALTNSLPLHWPYDS